jgi:hypothetical protein
VPLPDIDTIATLGGKLQNYAPVADPLTDLAADLDNNNRCDTAMMTRLAQKSWCAITLAATTNAIVLLAHEAQWGNGGAVAPVPAHVSTGIYRVTYPATVEDELGNSHTLNFRWGEGHVRGSAAYTVNVVPVAPNMLMVYVQNYSGALADAAGTSIDVKGF